MSAETILTAYGTQTPSRASHNDSAVPGFFITLKHYSIGRHLHRPQPERHVRTVCVRTAPPPHACFSGNVHTVPSLLHVKKIYRKKACRQPSFYISQDGTHTVGSQNTVCRTSEKHHPTAHKSHSVRAPRPKRRTEKHVPPRHKANITPQERLFGSAEEPVPHHRKASPAERYV